MLPRVSRVRNEVINEINSFSSDLAKRNASVNFISTEMNRHLFCGRHGYRNSNLFNFRGSDNVHLNTLGVSKLAKFLKYIAHIESKIRPYVSSRKLMLHNAHNLTIGHCNMQGGLTGLGKTSEISQLIKKHDLDILALNETNLNDTIDSSTLNIPVTYDFIRKDREVGSRGGCGLLVSRNCAYKVVTMNTNIDNIEALWVKICSSNIYVVMCFLSV